MGIDFADVEKLRAWLIETPHVDDGGVTFMRDFMDCIREHGLPIMRASLGLMTKHPELFWRSLQWTDDSGVNIVERTHETLASPFFTKSPIAQLRRGTESIRVRLVDGALPYPICEDLRALGATDYLAQALPFANGEISFASWATRAREGFADSTLRALTALAPMLARRLELESAYHGTRALLEVYLGPNAARRVLNGQFRRGGGERIEAVIWFCDMRGFTELSDKWPAEASRLEGLCKSLATPLTLSERFVQGAAAPDVVFLGDHLLKGVAAPLRVFTLQKFRPPR